MVNSCKKALQKVKSARKLLDSAIKYKPKNWEIISDADVKLSIAERKLKKC